MNQLDSLRQFTAVVADTGDFRQLAQFQPQDATTNPSLILKAVQKPEYAPLLAQTVAAHRGRPLDEVADRLLVRFGCEILALIPGRVSTEVDARLSFDENATYTRAERLIELYQAEGVPVERVLIKIAATWEGIRAAERLQRRGIKQSQHLPGLHTIADIRLQLRKGHPGQLRIHRRQLARSDLALSGKGALVRDALRRAELHGERGFLLRRRHLLRK